MLGLGCGGLLLALPRNIDSGKRIEAASRSEAGLKRAVHDFGNVLNDSKPLRYVFRFNNKSLRALRVLESVRSSTCCTTFGTLPERVEAGDVLEVPVELKTAGKGGHLRGEFVLRTDSPAFPIVVMELRANLFEPFEVRDIGAVARVVLGRPMSRRFEVVLRTAPSGPIVWPAVSGMSARLEDVLPTPTDATEGIVESKRTLELLFDGAGEPGTRSGSVRFTWPDGREKSYLVGWEVVPPLRPAPRMVIVQPEAGERPYTVVLQSDDLPFQVLGIEGPGVRSYRIVSCDKFQARLEIRLDPAGLGEVSQFRIATDHPRVAQVGVNIIVPKPRPEAPK
jgi:hypothetical protein